MMKSASANKADGTPASSSFSTAWARWLPWCAVVVSLPPLVGLAGFAFFYSMPVATAQAIVGIAAVLALPFRFRMGRIVKISSLAILVLVSVATVPISLTDMNRHTDNLTEKVKNGGPAALSMGDRLGVYLLGLWAIGLGAIVFGEAAEELFYLYLPAEDGLRSFESDFAMASPKFKEPITSFSRSLERLSSEKTSAEMKARRVAWKSYSGTMAENRVALALNPCTLSASASRVNGRWLITASAVVEVEFPPRSRVTLARFGDYRLEVEEGLFWALQESGWLHPYTAKWIWTTTPEDLPIPKTP